MNLLDHLHLMSRDHIVLAFFEVIAIIVLLNASRQIWVKTQRTIRVLFRGWPPPHLDADGDWKPEPKKTDDDKIEIKE